jgi:hypothetical protein
MLELPIIVIEMPIARVGRFQMGPRTALGRFGVFKSFFERLVFPAGSIHPVRGPRLFDCRDTTLWRALDRILHLCFGQDRHETPPRATREKPGRCSAIAPEF